MGSGQLFASSAKAITLDLPSGALAALRVGHDGDPDVLLVPGYTGSKEDFAPIFDALASANLRVTSIDLPGQYQSAGPDDRAAYAPARLAQCLLEITDVLGPDVHLVGHSFGGLVARAAVIDEPTRFRDLVLLDSGPAAISGLRRARIDALEPMLPEGMTGVWAAMQTAFATEPGYVPAPPDLSGFLEQRFVASSPAMLEGMGNAIRDEPDRVDELRATGIRTLVACGVNDDAWLPSVQKEMADRLGAPFEVIPDAAHSPAIENPDATIAVLLDFWQASWMGDDG